jgi:hypothetical protein
MLRDAKIRELCKRLTVAKDDAEAVHLVSQLRRVLHEHVETVRGNLFVFVRPFKDDPAMSFTNDFFSAPCVENSDMQSLL